MKTVKSKFKKNRPYWYVFGDTITEIKFIEQTKRDDIDTWTWESVDGELIRTYSPNTGIFRGNIHESLEDAKIAVSLTLQKQLNELLSKLRNIHCS